MEHFVFGKEDTCLSRLVLYPTAQPDVRIIVKRISIIMFFEWTRKSTVFVIEMATAASSEHIFIRYVLSFTCV